MNRRRLFFFRVVLGLIVVALFELSSAIVVRVVALIRPHLVVESSIESHFDTVSDEFRAKFVASYHHPERGWDYRPNTEQNFQNSIGQPWRASIDESGARRHSIAEGERVQAGPPLVASYGDSFTRGGEVNDDETWQYFLERETGCRIQNFGVGGYGTGQALLKFEAHLAEGRVAPVTILGIHTSNLRRVGNAFRPFVSPGTGLKLGFKPAFRPDGRGGLRIVENRYQDPAASLADLERLAAEASLYDRWAEGRARIAFPHTVQALRIARDVSMKWLYPSEGLWQDPVESGVMRSIVERFARAAAAAGSVPVVLLFPDGSSLATGTAPPYTSFVAELLAADPDLHVIDVSKPESDAKRMQIRPFRGHFSPYGNRIVAGALSSWLRQKIGALAIRCSQAARATAVDRERRKAA